MDPAGGGPFPHGTAQSKEDTQIQGSSPENRYNLVYRALSVRDYYLSLLTPWRTPPLVIITLAS